MATWIPYDQFMLRGWNGGNHDLDTDAMKVGLLDATYTPNVATDDLWSVLAANEVSGGGYTAGGEDVVNPTVTLAGSVVTWDFNDITWAQNAGGFTDARYCVVYRTIDSKVIAYADFTSDKGNVAGDLVLEMDANGVLTLARI